MNIVTRGTQSPIKVKFDLLNNQFTVRQHNIDGSIELVFVGYELIGALSAAFCRWETIKHPTTKYSVNEELGRELAELWMHETLASKIGSAEKWLATHESGDLGGWGPVPGMLRMDWRRNALRGLGVLDWMGNRTPAADVSFD